MGKSVERIHNVILKEELSDKDKEIISLKRKIARLEKRNKLMQCCANCEYDCGHSSFQIIKDKDGVDRYIFNCWNSKLGKYCHVGDGVKPGEGHECWKLRVNKTHTRLPNEK